MITKKLTLFIILIATLAVSGCFTPPSTNSGNTVYLQSQFDAAYARKQMAPGNNAIVGSAFVRTNDGEVVTAAGCRVFLFPVTLYATERVQAIYGNSTRAFLTLENEKSLIFAPDVPEYTQYQRETIADARGRFKFTGLANGDFYLGTAITWTYTDNRGKSKKTGGTLMQRVTVSGGVVQDVVLSQ